MLKPICQKPQTQNKQNAMSKKETQTPPATSLRALAENKLDGLTKSTTFRIDPKLVHFEKGFNLRTENEELELHVDRLFLAMKQGAFIPPIDVQIVNGKVIARDGHCRQRAAMRLRKEMPEYTLECRQLRGNEQDAVLHMLGTGSGSKPLTPLEQGKGYLRLIKMGMAPVAIAEKLGVSRVTVDNGITLAEAPIEVQKAIESGHVSSTTARDAVKQGEAGVTALLEAVETKKAKPAATEKAGKEPAKKKVTAKTLKGTAAAKPKTKDEPVKVEIVKPAVTVIATNVVAPSDVQFIVSRECAGEALRFLKDFMGEDVKLNSFAAVLETALM